ncbi:SRPBCC family protein [Geodermatophilus amargosae]|uniref:SRPBCC family protein n=1 Tax=Geodermatophilus amargosae TaxID=1296565 RepID=UPI0034DFA03D
MNVTETVVVAADPDTVWAVAGDAGAIAGWVPALESSRMEGDVRHGTFAGGGGDATERIVEHDDAARTYVYEYLTGPLALEEYRSRLSVREHAEGAEVVWASDFAAGSPEEEGQLAEAISGIYRGALAELKGRLES